MNVEHVGVGDLLAAAAAIRVFGPDLCRLARRAAAAGVRLGASELTQARGREQYRGRR